MRMSRRSVAAVVMALAKVLATLGVDGMEGFRCESLGDLGEVNRYEVAVIAGLGEGGYERLAVAFDMGRVRLMDDVDFEAWLTSLVCVLRSQREG